MWFDDISLIETLPIPVNGGKIMFGGYGVRTGKDRYRFISAIPRYFSLHGLIRSTHDLKKICSNVIPEKGTLPKERSVRIYRITFPS